MKYLRRIYQFLLSPVMNWPIFFAALTLMGALAPIAAIIDGEQRRIILLLTLFESSFYAYIACALGILFHKKWYRAVVCSMYGVFVLVEILHRATLFSPLSYESLRSILATNSHEATGAITQFASTAIIVASIVSLVSIALITVLITKIKAYTPRLPQWTGIIVLPIVSSGACFAMHNLSFLRVDSFEQMLEWQTSGIDNENLINIIRIEHASPITKAIYFGNMIRLENSQIRIWEQRQRAYLNEDPPHSSADSTLQIAIIIGESFIKSHSSIYGYRLRTSPRLEQEMHEGRLTPFSDMVSVANYTIASIRRILNIDTTQTAWDDAPYLPLFYSQGGWKVNLLTNQYKPGVNMADLGGMFYNPVVKGLCYSYMNSDNNAFDMDFVDEQISEQPSLMMPRGHSLDIWHLKGQHFPAKEAYPADNPTYAIFSADSVPASQPWLDDEKRTVVAHYANATAYNDSVVSKIISLYRDSNAIVIYFSDHGEEMYDSAPYANRNRPHPEDMAWMHRQFDVPFFVWMSDIAKEQNPQLAHAIVEAKDRPATLGLLSQMLLNIGGFTDSKYYKAQLDPISPGYQPTPRSTFSGYVYDRQ